MSAVTPDTQIDSAWADASVSEPAVPRAKLSGTPEYLLDVRLTVSAEVGRVQMPVRQVMALTPGSLVELQRGASEPVEILANGRCIARGEIVVIGDQFGVRITELGPNS
jgi:flagellar motor switch protein FliN/FliY